MKLSTAIKLVEKEAYWLGCSVKEVIVEVKKYGKKVYSEKIVEAVEVISLYNKC